jgi:hypothetical protein
LKAPTSIGTNHLKFAENLARKLLFVTASGSSLFARRRPFFPWRKNLVYLFPIASVHRYSQVAERTRIVKPTLNRFSLNLQVYFRQHGTMPHQTMFSRSTHFPTKASGVQHLFFAPLVTKAEDRGQLNQNATIEGKRGVFLHKQFPLQRPNSGITTSIGAQPPNRKASKATMSNALAVPQTLPRDLLRAPVNVKGEAGNQGQASISSRFPLMRLSQPLVPQTGSSEVLRRFTSQHFIGGAIESDSAHFLPRAQRNANRAELVVKQAPAEQASVAPTKRVNGEIVERQTSERNQSATQTLDINRLVDQVYQLIERKRRIERERRGL